MSGFMYGVSVSGYFTVIGPLKSHPSIQEQSQKPLTLMYLKEESNLQETSKSEGA